MDKETINRYILIEKIERLEEQKETLRRALREIKHEWDHSVPAAAEKGYFIPVNVYRKIADILEQFEI